MKRSHFQIAVYLLAVFLSGVFVGAFAFRLYTVRTVEAGGGGRPTPEDYRRKYMNEMKSRLSLDDKQLSDLNSVLDATRARYAAVKVRYKPELDKIHDEQVEEVRNLLTATQKVEYDKYRKERELERARQAGRKP
jgi:hypothetical protein